MKRITSFLSLALALLAFTACGGGGAAVESVADISREIRVDDPLTVRLFDTFNLKDDELTVAAARKNAEKVAEQALWKHFIQYYYEAYGKALAKRDERLS